MNKITGAALMGLAAIMILGGCKTGGNTLGDGQIDQVEAAVIRLAVGAAMTAKPELIPPAYAVSTAALALLGGDETTPLAEVETAVDDQLEKLELTAYERQSARDLLALVKARILAEMGTADAAGKKLVVKQVVQIVRDTASARLNAI